MSNLVTNMFNPAEGGAPGATPDAAPDAAPTPNAGATPAADGTTPPPVTGAGFEQILSS